MLSLIRRHLPLLGLLLLSVSPSLRAQLSNATIKGTVVDPTGGVVPNAQVELTKTGTGERRTEQSRADGRYDFTALPPGEYELKTSVSGFAPWAGKLTL